MISVILLNYFSYKDVYKYVYHLNEFVENKLHFAIVDNSNDLNEWEKLKDIFEVKTSEEISFDESYKLIIKSNIILIRNDCNAGYARGNNLGIKIANKYFNDNYLLISNTDLILKNKISFNKWIDEFSQNKRVAVIGPEVLGLDNKKQSPSRKMSFNERWGINLLVYPFNKYLYKRPPEIMEIDCKAEVYRLQGSFLFVEYNRLKSVNFFDENTFLYAEELILAEKLAKENMCMEYDPAISIIHNHNQIIGSFYSDLKKDLLRLKSESYYYEYYLNYPHCIYLIGIIMIYLYYFKKRIVCMIKK